jgi:CRISPR system Cascade subunit CasD
LFVRIDCTASSTLGALLKVPLEREERERDEVRLLWSEGEGVDSVRIDKDAMLTDERNWVSGLHGGGRRVYEGTSPSDCFGVKEKRP